MNNKTIHTILKSKSHLIPMAVYDVSIIKKQKKLLENSFKNSVNKLTIAYSYKTNTAAGSTMLDLGCSFQVTSINHLKEVQKLIVGKKKVKIVYNSRSLTANELKIVINCGAHLIINSLHQYNLVQDFAKKNIKKIEVGIRIDTQSFPKNTFFKTANTGLGLMVQDMEHLLFKSKFVKVVGLHTHIASQNTDPVSVKKAIDVLYKIFEQNNFNFQYLNLGGGFPIQYEKTVPSIANFASKINPVLKKIRKQNSSLEFIIEPGRFLVGPAGFLFVKVTDAMSRNKGKIVVVNSSIFSSVRDRILSKYNITIPCLVFGKQAKSLKKYLIVGSSPASCDVFGEYQLPDIDIGDILIFTQAGAYCLSNDNFTGIERPQEFLLINDRLIKI